MIPTLKATDRVLPDVWPLVAPGPNGVVEDTEALCVGVLVETIRRHARAFNGDIDWDESLDFLLCEAVRQHDRYDPSKRKGTGSFSGYLYDRLRFRLIDHWRVEYGRAGSKRTVEFDDGGHAAGDLRVRGLHGVAGGDAADRSDADRWLGADGDFEGDGVERGEGRRAGEAASAVDGRAGAGARGPAGRPVAVASHVDCECGWRSYRQAPNGIDRWHLPDFCLGCGRALLELVESVTDHGSGGLEEREVAA